MDALGNARKKAYTMRAERAALKKQEEASKAIANVEAIAKAQKKPIDLDTTQHPKGFAVDGKDEEEEEQPEVIYRKKPPKKKIIVVVQEESSF